MENESNNGKVPLISKIAYPFTEMPDGSRMWERSDRNNEYRNQYGRQTLPRMVRIQISDRLVHTQVHRFFCNISALLPGFLLLNSTHKPAPVPYAPSPSCIQLDATAFSL